MQKIVGWVIAIIGLGLTVYAVESSIRHGIAVDRFAVYVGLGLFGFGTYIIAPTWLENLVAKVRSYLPGGQPPSST